MVSSILTIVLTIFIAFVIVTILAKFFSVGKYRDSGSNQYNVDGTPMSSGFDMHGRTYGDTGDD
jgi:uncharacterized membrane protein